MNKIPFFIDGDETVLDSIPAVTQVANERYNTNVDYKDLKQYDFKDIFPMLKKGELMEIFESDRFWEIVKIKEGCLDVLNKKENADRYKYVLTTLGTPKNLYKKSLYFSKNLPIITTKYSIENDGSEPNKQFMNMKNGIFLDDHIDNLLSSNATYKICFKEKIYPWNQGWNGSSVSNWKDVESYMNDIWEIESCNKGVE